MYEGLVNRLPSARARTWGLEAAKIAPGFLVAGTIAMAATFLSDHYGAPVMLFALLLGMAFNFLSQDSPCAPGVAFTARTVLRFGVGLLGARITAGAVVALGPSPLLVAIAGVTLTVVFGAFLARRMGFTRDFGLLTGGSVGICGASAALALSSFLPKGERGITERDTIFTVLGVTTLSTIAMVLYPILATSLGFGPERAGVFLGATIHDVAQVVGAGYSLSDDTGNAATLTKLLRVAMLVPVVLAITFLLFRGTDRAGKRPPFPFFLTAFIVLVVVNSIGLIPAALGAFLTGLSSWALVAAIAALGIKTSLKDLAAVGPRALILLVAETGFIAVLVLAILFVSP